MRIPTPGSLLGSVVGSVVGSVAGPLVQAGAGVVGAVGAASTALDQAVALVPRAVLLLDRVEVLVGSLERLLAEGEDRIAQAGRVLEQVAATSARSDEVVALAGAVTRKTDRTVEAASGLLQRTDALVRPYDEVARALLPAARRFASELDAAEVDAAIALVDRLPRVLAHLDEDVLPMLTQLEAVGPDVHAILEVVEDLRQVVSGLPGVGLLRRLGDDSDDADAGSGRTASA